MMSFVKKTSENDVVGIETFDLFGLLRPITLLLTTAYRSL